MTTYFIFDMDETLAELYPLFYFIGTLRLKDTVSDSNKLQIPNSLDYTLNDAYNYFVLSTLKEETSDKPLGILRPGILDVMMRLYELQKLRKIKNVVIYSNNGHLQSLEFIRDLIHAYLGSDNLIKDCIHWDHPMRKDEINSTNTKTWNILKQILVEGACNAPETLEASDVYFFDDLDHTDLQEHLGPNYYKVPAYDFRASFDRIATLYKNALIYSKTDTNLLAKYIKDIFINSRIVNGSINRIIYSFKQKTPDTVNKDILPPLNDEGITMMLDAVKNAEMKGGVIKRIKIKTNTKKRKRVKRTLSRIKN
jgi:hypothetical protein